jgi:polar amino acid transport system substrate-binding protein
LIRNSTHRPCSRYIVQCLLVSFCGLFVFCDLGLAADKTLIVGIKSSPPFTIKENNGEWSGLTADLWRDIAQKEHLAYEWRELSLAEILEGLENGDLDIGVAALTMTEEREKCFDFTHPFYSDGLSIAVREQGGNVWVEMLKRLVSLDFLTAVSALLGLLLVFGVLLWLFERKKNPSQFGGSLLSGIGSGLWWSAVTMTTVGYGDKSPTTFFGRMLALVWMFASIIVISSFTASIATSLTVNSFKTSISNAKDLKKVCSGIIEETSGVDYMDKIKADYKSYKNLDAALNALLSGEVSAVVYDRPILLYVINKRNIRGVQVLNEKINQENYAFGVSRESHLREMINRNILSHLEGEDWSDLLDKYLGMER